MTVEATVTFDPGGTQSSPYDVEIPCAVPYGGCGNPLEGCVDCPVEKVGSKGLNPEIETTNTELGGDLQ